MFVTAHILNLQTGTIAIMFLQIMKKSAPFFSFSTFINGKVCVKYYDTNDYTKYSLQRNPQNYFTSLSSLHIPTEEHDNITDKNNRREGIEFERLVSIQKKSSLRNLIMNGRIIFNLLSYMYLTTIIIH